MEGKKRELRRKMKNEMETETKKSERMEHNKHNYAGGKYGHTFTGDEKIIILTYASTYNHS